MHLDQAVLQVLSGQTCHGQPWLVLLAAGLVVMLGRGEGVSVAPNDALMGFYLGSEREQCAGVPTPRITKVSTKKKQDWEF